MEWAWKPMAAVMNENKTDLVYWVPPLYASNILNSFTGTEASSSNSSPVSSLCSSPSLSRARSLSSRRATLADGTTLGSRKKRLSKRRENLTQRYSIDEGRKKMEHRETNLTIESAIPHLKSMLHHHSGGENSDGKDGSNTMKRDLVVEFEAEEIDLVQIIPNDDIDDEIESHNRETLKMKSKKDKHKSDGDKSRHKSIPSILKILEKVSHLHDKPKQRPLTRRNAKIERTVSSGSQKIKRPSLKVYQNSPKCGSGRRATAPVISTQPPETEAKEARMVITGKAASGPRLSIKRASRQSSVRSRSASITTTGLKVSQVTEAELRSAHLEMMIKILATLYEEKISRQDSELKSLKDKYKTTDKIVKQVVHNMLEVKTEIKSLREYLIKHEEIFLHFRTQQLLAQQSIPEEIEEGEDLEMCEIEPHHADSNMDHFGKKKHETNDVHNEPSNEAKHESVRRLFHEGIMDNARSNIMVPDFLDLGEETFRPTDLNLDRNFVLNIEDCLVLDPPNEFQSPIEERIAKHKNAHRLIAKSPDVTECQFAKMKTFKDHLEAQDNNEFNLHYHKLETHHHLEEHVDEQFLATEYVCDYHPREEMRIKQLRDKIYFEETLSNIEEDDRCSIISRQRSDDSTNI